MDLFEEQKTKPTILLLDYQATLVANFNERQAWYVWNKNTPYTEWIKQERLRSWIVELAKKEQMKVILITARSAKYQNQTLSHIKNLLAWQPDEWYFNEYETQPHICKKAILDRYIYPKHGTDKSKYIAFESNAVTRKMYEQEKIYAIRVGDEPLTKIPKV